MNFDATCHVRFVWHAVSRRPQPPTAASCMCPQLKTSALLQSGAVRMLDVRAL